MPANVPNSLALVGNPGAGKSTILNGLANEAHFKAGISVGGGLTYKLDEYESNGFTLYDTPGLSDIRQAKRAGKALDELLQKRKDIKICFCVVLEGGRASKDDAATIDAVLSAIKIENVKDRFGVIINKVSPRVMEKLNNNSEGEAVIVRNGLTGKYRTKHWFYLPFESDLFDADDKKFCSEDLTVFFASLPGTKPKDAAVEEIDTDSLEEKKEEHAKRIEELRNLHAKEIRELTKTFERELKSQKKLITNLKQQVDIANSRIEELTEQVTEKHWSDSSDEGSYPSRDENNEFVSTALWGGAGLTTVGLLSGNPLAFLGGVSSLSAGVGAWLNEN